MNAVWRGSVDRIGAQESCCEVEIGSWSEQRTMPVADHGVAVAACLEQLTNPEHGVLQDASGFLPPDSRRCTVDVCQVFLPWMTIFWMR